MVCVEKQKSEKFEFKMMYGMGVRLNSSETKVLVVNKNNNNLPIFQSIGSQIQTITLIIYSIITIIYLGT